MIDIRRAQSIALSQLEPYHIDTARIDIEVLLAFTLAKTRTYLYAHPETMMTNTEFLTFQNLIAKRSLGVPVAYLTGMREFWSLPLHVNEETLIPRPETELIVEITLQMMSHIQAPTILDLGTGSGAIALALAKEREDGQIMATDYSEGALKIAKKNAESLRIRNISFLQSDWFANIGNDQQFHVIVSNPPYIAANDPHLKQGDLCFEPLQALIGGTDGLSPLLHIIEHSIGRLKKDGLLLIEHGFSQKRDVVAMLKEYEYVHIQSWQDLQGNDRVSGGRIKS